MIDPNLLILLCASFGVTGLVAFHRQHWTEFGVCLFVAFFSLFGLVVRLVS